MSHSSLSRRRFCGAVIAAVPVVRSVVGQSESTHAPEADRDAADPTPSLQAIRRPCSLRKVCRALSDRYKVSVEPDPELEELRVVWAYGAEPSLEMILGRLAELTDCRVAKGATASGHDLYQLERRPASRGLEARWRKDSLRHSLDELLRAADEHEHGTLNTASYTKNIQTYLQMGRAGQIKYLKLLTPEQTERLLQGERVQLSPGQISASEVEQIIQERYSGPGREDELPEHTQQYREQELQSVQQHGLGLQIDFARKGWMFYLILWIGERGANALAGFGADEVGLPFLRVNPYRWIEAQGKAFPAPLLSSALKRRLEADLVLPEGEQSCEDAVQALSRAAAIDLVSDGYLCRLPSRVFVRPGERLVLAARGLTVAEALDLICQRYGYLWWEKDGCCYLRSRTWPWDLLYEVPDAFLDLWSDALRRGTIGAREIAALGSLPPLQLNGLGDLGGGGAMNRCGLDSEEVQQYLRLFRQCTPAQQMQWLGDGLLVPSEALAGSAASQSQSTLGGPAAPVLLRLTRRMATESSAAPPIIRVTMRVTRPLEPTRWQPEFSVELPRGAGQLNPPETTPEHTAEKGEDARTSNR